MQSFLCCHLNDIDVECRKTSKQQNNSGNSLKHTNPNETYTTLKLAIK